MDFNPETMKPTLRLLNPDQLLVFIREQGEQRIIATFGQKFYEELVEIVRVKPKRGRPRKPEGSRMPSRMVMMPDDLWEYCLAQEGGASPFLRRLVKEHLRDESVTR